jgi:hypothetical protein
MFADNVRTRERAGMQHKFRHASAISYLCRLGTGLKGPRKPSRQKSTRSHFRSANIFFHLRKEQTSSIIDGIDVSIHATKKREEKRGTFVGLPNFTNFFGTGSN